jgi:hypothetical protein
MVFAHAPAHMPFFCFVHYEANVPDQRDAEEGAFLHHIVPPPFDSWMADYAELILLCHKLLKASNDAVFKRRGDG